MSRFVWSPEYELGIEVIDHQHQRIIEYINQIYYARGRAGFAGRDFTESGGLHAVAFRL
ncbi:hypothetical protein [uncultured Spongiibacter sp.]|uniref:hypothetical protein n=1 Tax=Spongiibacter tropicus TaxID=454602 RepID=UPI002591DCCA|nr:hypothetical protein [uncultured Spongiibacter sp.]